MRGRIHRVAERAPLEQHRGQAGRRQGLDDARQFGPADGLEQHGVARGRRQLLLQDGQPVPEGSGLAQPMNQHSLQSMALRGANDVELTAAGHGGPVRREQAGQQSFVWSPVESRHRSNAQPCISSGQNDFPGNVFGRCLDGK